MRAAWRLVRRIMAERSGQARPPGAAIWREVRGARARAALGLGRVPSGAGGAPLQGIVVGGRAEEAGALGSALPSPAQGTKRVAEVHERTLIELRRGPNEHSVHERASRQLGTTRAGAAASGRLTVRIVRTHRSSRQSRGREGRVVHASPVLHGEWGISAYRAAAAEAGRRKAQQRQRLGRTRLRLRVRNALQRRARQPEGEGVRSDSEGKTQRGASVVWRQKIVHPLGTANIVTQLARRRAEAIQVSGAHAGLTLLLREGSA